MKSAPSPSTADEAPVPQPSEATSAVAREIAEASNPSRAYFIMTGLATVLACYGLYANSPAVIIGAMLVAMLLNPITGLSFALATADPRLAQRAASAEILGVASVYGVAVIVGFIHRDLPLTAEMLNRSDPGLLDLVIAVAGGAAVAYATGHSRLNAAIVGVAIATSLVPPLAASAIMLTHGEPTLALGAMVLFASNYAAILFAAMSVFWLTGRRAPRLSRPDTAVVHAFRVGQIGLFIALAAHLAYRFERQVDARTRAVTIERSLSQGLQANPGARLIEVRIAPALAPGAIVATVRAPTAVSPQEVARLERGLPEEARRGLTLRVRTVPVVVAESSGYLFADDAP